jgi:hypothetical protein
MKPAIKRLEEQQAAQGLKKCPFCAEMIKPDAKVCRYCGRDLPAEPAAAPIVAQDDASGGADQESERQRRDRLRAQLEDFRRQQPPRER